MKNDIEFTILSTDVIVFTVDGNNLKVLLTTASSKAFKNLPTLPGNLVKPQEKIEEAVKRVLSGVLKNHVKYSEQLYTFGNPNRDPVGRVVSVAYMVLIPWKSAEDAIKPKALWRDVKNLPVLAYDHREMVNTAVKRLASKLTYTNVVNFLMPEEFTLAELQNTYELVLGKKLDKRNFRKKISSLNLLQGLSKKKVGAYRPAQLFTFKDKKFRELENI